MAQQVFSASKAGSMSGTTSVELVPPCPGGYECVVRSIRFVNIDTAVVNISVSIVSGGTTTQLDRLDAIPVNDVYRPISGADVEVLGTGDRIIAAMSGAAATTNPTYKVSYFLRKLNYE